MSKKENSLKGQEGENIAANFLEKKGFKIIEHNFKVYCGEIDLIASYKDELVFVEVKARKGSYFGIGADSINYAKKIKLINTAEVYISKKGKNYKSFRFDVISVDLQNMKVIEHIENAFDKI